MRLFIALIVIIYLVGIGVELSPTIQAKWNGASASDLVTSVVHELPNAMAWPVRVLPAHNRTWLIVFDRLADVCFCRKVFDAGRTSD